MKLYAGHLLAVEIISPQRHSFYRESSLGDIAINFARDSWSGFEREHNCDIRIYLAPPRAIHAMWENENFKKTAAICSSLFALTFPCMKVCFAFRYVIKLYYHATDKVSVSNMI